MVYADRIQTLANNPTWAEQVEQGEIEEPALSYVTLKEREMDSVNQANATEPMLDSHGTVINNMCPSQDLETWLFHIWSINLWTYRIAVFIRQQNLEDKIAEDITQISEFGFAA